MPATFLVALDDTAADLGFVDDILGPYTAARLPKWLAKDGRADATAASLAGLGVSLPSTEPATVSAAVIAGIAAPGCPPEVWRPVVAVWTQAFQGGAFRAQVHRDAFVRMRTWHRARRRILTVSNLPEPVQRLFMAHTAFGDLGRWLSGAIDPAHGSLGVPETWVKIAAHHNLDAPDTMLVAANTDWLAAAAEAGFVTHAMDRRQSPAPFGDLKV